MVDINFDALLGIETFMSGLAQAFAESDASLERLHYAVHFR